MTDTTVMDAPTDDSIDDVHIWYQEDDGLVVGRELNDDDNELEHEELVELINQNDWDVVVRGNEYNDRCYVNLATDGDWGYEGESFKIPTDAAPTGRLLRAIQNARCHILITPQGKKVLVETAEECGEYQRMQSKVRLLTNGSFEIVSADYELTRTPDGGYVIQEKDEEE